LLRLSLSLLLRLSPSPPRPSLSLLLRLSPLRLSPLLSLLPNRPLKLIPASGMTA
jgi:hypothetical protein